MYRGVALPARPLPVVHPTEVSGRLAISVRQPWAWAIFHAGKDVENRSSAGPFRRGVGQRILVHAGSVMSSADYEFAASRLMEKFKVTCPPKADLVRGGVIGEVTVMAIVDAHPSPWFRGPFALVLADAEPLPFVSAKGWLGLFTVKT
jgi:hypothetical protein